LLSFKSEYIRFQNLDEDRIEEIYQSRINSQADLIPAEKPHGKPRSSPQTNDEMPF
jgi:hypothetical protein